MDVTLVVFAVVYFGMVVGGLPALRIDRPAIALVGALALVGAGALSAEAAWRAVDVPTIALLFGLMVVSAQLARGGFYSLVARQLARSRRGPVGLLLWVVIVAGVLSALLVNDIICLAMTPIVVDACRRRGLDPVPFLLGVAAASNVGSAATLIGNPQNMLIGQSLQLSFLGYLADAGPPCALGLLATWGILVWLYRGTFGRAAEVAAAPDLRLDAAITGKGLVVLGTLVGLFLFAPWPREVLTLVAAAVLLLGRRVAARELLDRVDWHLCLLFMGLFVVNHALQGAGHLEAAYAWLRGHGVDPAQPAWLFATSVLGSNVVSNVPAVMLLLPAATHPDAGAILALSSTFAGNLFLVGSIANLIVVEQARRLGVEPRARSWVLEHARVGVPVTLVTLALAALWLAR